MESDMNECINLTKWSNTLKQPTNCLSLFDHFVGLALERLNTYSYPKTSNFFLVMKQK